MIFSRSLSWILAGLVLGATPLVAQTATVHATPQDALEALVGALKIGTIEAALEAIDPGATDLIQAHDDETRLEAWNELLDLYNEGYRFVPTEGGVTIEFGADDWPFPISLVKNGSGGWIFDIEAAHEELSDRQIGENELGVIEIMEAYVEVQAEFRTVDHDGDGVLEFAAHVISSAEDRDGLYWPGDDSPTGDLVARSSLDGYSEDGIDVEPDPYLGYFIRVLNSQGPDAPGGEMSYLVNGHQLAGHALLAVPAEYGVTGINSFMVAENGIVLEADLGEDSLETALDMTIYNPDDAWLPVE